MERNKLITPSLLNSFNWLNKCPHSWREKALEDLTNLLNRAPFKPNKYFVRGNKYENQVRSICRGISPNDVMSTAVEMAELCKGGKWQEKIRAFIYIDDVPFCISGRIDVLFPDEIIDIKTTTTFKGDESYLSTSQHILYLFSAIHKKMPQRQFKYLVTDFEQIHEVPFEVGDPALLRVEVWRMINEFLDYLNKHKDLLEAYETKFCY